MARPVRGSPVDGTTGASSDGEKPLNAPRRWPKLFAWLASVSRPASFFDTTMGGDVFQGAEALQQVEGLLDQADQAAAQGVALAFAQSSKILAV